MGRIKKAGLKPPGIATLMITNGCNLKCRHCWPESLSHEAVRPVDVQALKSLIAGFESLGAEEICLTGGEPLTHPHWMEILRFACRRKGLKRVRFQTNGVLLTERDAKGLAKIRQKELIIQVSLEGADGQTHDVLRGKGSFEGALRGIKRLTAMGLGPQTTVSFTETRKNFNSLADLIELLDELGVGRLVSGTLVRAGRAVHGPELPTPDQYRSLLRRYHRDETFRKRYHKMANIACLEWWLGKAHSLSETCGCLEMPYVKADGALYPCLMLPADHLAVRNAHEDPLEELLMKAVSRWAGLPALLRRRSSALTPCKTCSGKSHCKGGCMGRAHASTGNVMEEEDRCMLRKAVYAWKPLRAGEQIRFMSNGHGGTAE